MESLQIDIKDPKVRGLLNELAEMELIAIRQDSEKPSTTVNPRKAGWGKGTFIIHPSFYEPLEEFEEYE